jgi:hypothetical protein
MAFDLGSAYGSIQIDVADAMAGLDKLGIAMAAASAVAVAAIAKMTDSASNLAEEISKSNVIWGEQAAEIESFADRAATALGLSKQSALEATSTFSVYADQMGLSGTEAAGFSTQMAALAADMASFSNTSPEEAIQALGSAFRGESDPIERYGVQLVGVTNGLEGSAKAMAIYQSILAQTGNAQGDFERTSGGLAAQQKILSAEFANVQTEIGTIFLPIALELTRVLRDVVEVIRDAVARFNELSPPIKTAILAVGGIVLAIGPALVAMTGIVSAVGMVTAALASPLIVPIGAAIAAVTALAAAFIFFGDDIVAVANSVLSYGVGIAQQLASGIMAGVSYVVDALSYIGDVITSWLIPNSPPKLLPEIDTWGTQTAQVYLDGWGQADFAVLDSIANNIEDALRDIAPEGDATLIDRIIGSREDIAAAIDSAASGGLDSAMGKIKEATAGLPEQFEQFAIASLKSAEAEKTLTAATDDLTKTKEAAAEQLAAADEKIKSAKEALKTVELEADTAIKESTKTVGEAKTALATIQAEQAVIIETAAQKVSDAEAELKRVVTQAEADKAAAKAATTDIVTAENDKIKASEDALATAQAAYATDYEASQKRMADAKAVLATAEGVFKTAQEDAATAITGYTATLDAAKAAHETAAASIGNYKDAMSAAKDLVDSTTGATVEQIDEAISKYGDLPEAVWRYTDSLADLEAAAQATTAAQQELNDVTAAQDAILDPLNAQLDALKDQERAIKNAAKAEKLRKEIADGATSADDKKLAQIELNKLALEDQIIAAKRDRDVAVDSAKDKLAAAKEVEAQQKAATAQKKADADRFIAQEKAAADASLKTAQNKFNADKAAANAELATAKATLEAAKATAAQKIAAETTIQTGLKATLKIQQEATAAQKKDSAEAIATAKATETAKIESINKTVAAQKAAVEVEKAALGEAKASADGLITAQKEIVATKEAELAKVKETQAARVAAAQSVVATAETEKAKIKETTDAQIAKKQAVVDAAQTAVTKAAEEVAAAQGAIDQYSKQNALLAEKKKLIEEAAKAQEATAAKLMGVGAGGGAAPKIGGGGRGGAAPKMGGGAMPAFEMPKIDPAFGQSLQAAGDAVVGVQTKMTAAKTAFDGFATTTGSVVTKIKEFATALLVQVTPEITKLQTGAVALGASIAQQLTPAVASIKEGLAAFATGAIALGGAIGEKLSPMVAAAKDAIVLFVSLLSTGLQSVATITTTVITDTITPLWNGLVTTIGAWGTAFGGVLTVAGAAMSALAALIIGDKDRIGTAFSDLKTAVTTTMGQLWTALQTSVTAFGTIFLTVVKSLTTSILGEFGYTKEQAEIKWGEIYLVIMNALTQAVEMVTGLGEDIKTALVTSIQAAIDGVTGLVSGMSSIGADMVAGIASGITGAAGQIGSAMTGAVGGAVDSVRRFLDSNSPSRYTAAVVGLPMTQGVAGGVEEGEPMVVAAMRQAVAAAISKVKKLTQESGESVNFGIGGTLRPNLPPSGGSVAPIRPILQGGGAGDTINVRIDSFTSNKREDVERLAESIADIIAKRKRK